MAASEDVVVEPRRAKAPRSEYATGLLLGLAAYTMWGVFPLYFPLLKPASALEILAHRYVWSLVVLAVIITVTRSWPKVLAIRHSRRAMTLLPIASVLIGINWGTYIWAVNAGHVVETALGYFINPLISVGLGVVLLRERLRPLQWVAVGIGVLAVAVLTFDYGRLPWIALVLACSFGLYGYVKKLAAVPAVESLTWETTFAAPIALGYLGFLEVSGAAEFGRGSIGTTLLLALVGVITAIPLLCFGGAVNRVPLTTMGLLQYLGPLLQFILGITYFHEEMPPSRWIGFSIVWLALAVFTFDAIQTTGRTRTETDN